MNLTEAMNGLREEVTRKTLEIKRWHDVRDKEIKEAHDRCRARIGAIEAERTRLTKAIEALGATVGGKSFTVEATAAPEPVGEMMGRTLGAVLKMKAWLKENPGEHGIEAIANGARMHGTTIAKLADSCGDFVVRMVPGKGPTGMQRRISLAPVAPPPPPLPAQQPATNPERINQRIELALNIMEHLEAWAGPMAISQMSQTIHRPYDEIEQMGRSDDTFEILGTGSPNNPLKIALRPKGNGIVHVNGTTHAAAN